MDVHEMITPDIQSLLPSEQTVRARGHALTAQLGPHHSRGLHHRSLRPMRFVAALGAIGAIAGVGVLALSDGDVVSQAQAFPVFATPHVTPQVIANGILGSFLKSEGEVPGNPPNPSAPDGPYWREAASHAFAFPTYWGTAYTFKKHDSRTGYTVCTVYPDYQTETIPYHGGWVGGCHTAPTIAGAAGSWETVPDPQGVEFVQLVSTNTTADVTAGSAPAKAVPIHNGVLSVRVTSQATLTVHSGSSTHTYHLDSTTTARATARGGTSNSYRSFAVFARKRTGRDRIPLYVQEPMRRSFRQLQIETNHSVLLSSLATQRTWLVPTRGRQLCSVETNLTANRRFDGGGMGCSGLRFSEIHGLNLYISGNSFAEVLPKHSSPVLISYKDGASTLLRADRDGIVRATFHRPVRLISFTGPTEVKTRFTPPPAGPQPAKH